MTEDEPPPSEDESDASPLCCLGMPGGAGAGLEAAEELSPEAWIVRAYFLPAAAAAPAAAPAVPAAEESEGIPEEEDFRLLPLVLLRENANMGGDFGAGGGRPGRADFAGEDFLLEVGLAGERSLTDGNTPSLNSSVLSDRPKTFHAAGDADCDCDFTAAASAMIEEESGGGGAALIDGNVPPLMSDSELVVLCSFSSGSRWSSSGGAWRLASSEPDPKIQPSVPGMM